MCKNAKMEEDEPMFMNIDEQVQKTKEEEEKKKREEEIRIR